MTDMARPAPEPHSHARDLVAFVTACPSSFHAAAELARRLEESGATRQREGKPWQPAGGSNAGSNGGSNGGGRYVRRDGAVVAWWLDGAAAAERGSAGAQVLAERLEVRVVGSHTDSPGFKLKPHPSLSVEGWAQAGVEVYGGPLLASWFDRDLAIAGRIVTADGAEHLVRTGPVARVPRLAVHLERGSGASEEHDKQRHTVPVLGLGQIDVLALVGRAAGPTGAIPRDIAAGISNDSDGNDGTRIVAHDLHLADTQEPALIGANEDLLASGRLDNLSSVHASLTAAERLARRAADRVAGAGREGSAGGSGGGGARAGGGAETGAERPILRVLVANDHEEVGSQTRSGAAGPLLEDVLIRTLRSLGLDEEDRARVLSRSSLLSADAGHGVHPNHAEKHDPTHHPRLGSGPLTKINAQQRYATDAPGIALWHRACAAAGVSAQAFVSNNEVPCGSTIGPITATRLGLRTVDVGVPLLSMHSARELAHVDDLAALSAAVEAYWAGA